MTPARKPASTRVFENFDLTETILLHLPLQDLLLSKAVCKDWKQMQDKTSDRIRKALFVVPFSEERIYYPECSTPHWYLNPKRSELAQAGIIKQGFIVGDDDDHEDDSEPVGHDTNTKVGNYDGDEAAGQKGKHKAEQHSDSMTMVVYTPKSSKASKASTIGDTEDNLPTTPKASKATPTDNDSPTTPKAKKVMAASDTDTDLLVTPKAKKVNAADNTDNELPTTPKAKKVMTASDADSEVFSTPKASKAKAASSTNADPATTPKATKTSANSMPQYNLFLTPTKLAEDKMMVSRVSGPFINPFLELIFDRFFKGAQGIWRPAVPDNVLNVGMVSAPKMVICPPVRYDDGTSYGRSRKSRAIQRYTSSWRFMHPFSAVTTSLEVECFDFGQLELTDSHGLTAGKMMELMGEHWGNTCPDCCIPDYWFGEFVRKLSIFDNARNRGNHGVKKLGLNNTGWEALAKLRAGRVSLVGTKDSVRPY